MLDTHARRFVEPFINAIARILYRAGLTANAVTLAAMLIGVCAALCVAADWVWTAIALLWLSGLLDAADGALARMTHADAFGAILDITFDRIVEIAVIVALAWGHPEARFVLVILAGVIAVAMSLFLSIAAAMRNHSVKSFHYAPGLGERTEAFICLTLMIAGENRLTAWSLLFVGVILYTMAQRLRHARLALTAQTIP
ncbi:MAG: CDP-alcohol phosphatidyltransferase family protein [Steroidobacteraceae bacterium]